MGRGSSVPRAHPSARLQKTVGSHPAAYQQHVHDDPAHGHVGPSHVAVRAPMSHHQGEYGDEHHHRHNPRGDSQNTALQQAPWRRRHLACRHWRQPHPRYYTGDAVEQGNREQSTRPLALDPVDYTVQELHSPPPCWEAIATYLYHKIIYYATAVHGLLNNLEGRFKSK